MKKNVCAVVVTYNRKKLLAECLDALLGQSNLLKKILIIDNASTEEIKNYLNSKGYLNIQCIQFIRLKTNIGGAGGFHEGIKRAHTEGFDWIWVMDDDAEPLPNALSLAYPRIVENKYAALANLKVGSDGLPQYNHHGWLKLNSNASYPVKAISPEDITPEEIEVGFSSFVGLLINSKVVDKIGYPKSEFFIHHDDVEYCWRISFYSPILLMKDSIIVHKDARNSESLLSDNKSSDLECTRNVMNVSWLDYFHPRNFMWLKKESCGIIKATYIMAFWYKDKIFQILAHDRKKLLMIIFFGYALLDGIKGNFDNERPKRILKKYINK